MSVADEAPIGMREPSDWYILTSSFLKKSILCGKSAIRDIFFKQNFVRKNIIFFI